ncbi:MAG: threonine synthase [Candidatus Heimdallarchaeota archaeon]|nr:threonine synthase [Candidatus Heimdallarchaeota archaeon]
MSYLKNMICKSCNAEYPPIRETICPECFGPLEIHYDLGKISEDLDISIIDKREKNIWRYKELLPVEENYHVNIHAGFTPLKHCVSLGDYLGLENLYIKDDSCNPTGSFKDRPASIAVSKAGEWGLEAVGCASTGNLAGATAAAAAAANLPCYIFVPKDLDQGKIIPTLLYGGQLVQIDGTYDVVNRLANLTADKNNWGFVNINLRAYYTEGSKTITYECCEQLGWQSPDRIIIPLGSGALLCTARKALDELEELQWIEKKQVKICGSQPIGCSPITEAFEKNRDWITPVQHPNTIVKSLAIGDPASGLEALDIIRSSEGWADSPNDEEILEAQALLARTEGIFTEPAGGSCIASLIRKVREGKVDPKELIVVYITGSGLKTIDTLEGIVHIPSSIKADVAEIEQLIQEVQ